MAVFLTGGGGKTSLRLASLLKDRDIPFLLGSRRGEAAVPPGMTGIRFNWIDPSTFSNPFQHNFSDGKKISAIYLVAPQVAEPSVSMNAFIDYAVKEHRIKRFVLLAGLLTEQGNSRLGKVWQHLLDQGVEYCVLRPNWFMENFSEGEHLLTIRKQNRIYTGCGDVKFRFISADDVAAVAMHALVDEKAQSTDNIILSGPELLTYHEAATKIGDVIGREILHFPEMYEQRLQRYGAYGLEPWLAQLLAGLESESVKRSEETPEETPEDKISSEAVERITGRTPLMFDEFARRNTTVWQQAL